MIRSNYIRKSVVAPYIDGLLDEKHANGYSYSCEEYILNRFDRYCVLNDLKSPEISKPFLEPWMEQTESEGERQRGKRISCVKQLLLFMASCGIRISYIPHDFYPFRRALPHIFEMDEICAFFAALDSDSASRDNFRKRFVMEYRLIFRWYLCCGLRNSEAAGIRTENVDLDKGILTILNAKGNKDRLVYMTDDLVKASRKYYSYLSDILGFYPEWFFPAKNPARPISNTTIDVAFNRYWNQTPYSGCNNKPTVHDFRFSFVVFRMNTWAEQGLDLQVMMPYLSRYLGHKSTDETFYYYYLVNDAYKTVEKNDTTANEVIPEVTVYE